MSTPLATVIIPNYNGRRFLSPLLESLSDQSESRMKVIVVDDASTDESIAYLREHHPRVRIIRNKTNQGFAGSCNTGLRAAKTPFVVLLNNDTHVDDHWLAQGLRPFENPQVAAVASLVLLAGSPHLIDTAGDVYSVAGGAVKRKHLQPFLGHENHSRGCFSASGVSAFYRRAAIERVGYLDDRFESYYEDVDLGFRLTWAGYQCVFAPKSICYHHLSSSYKPRQWRYHFNSARNAEIVWWAYLPTAMRRKYLLSHLCFLGLQGANKLRQGCLLPYLAGKCSVLRHRRHILEKRLKNHDWAAIEPGEIEKHLVRNWWNLHVSSRRSTKPAGNRPS